MQQFETERLICRHVNYGDEEFFVEHLNNPDYIAMVYDKGVRNIEDATNYIKEKCRPQIERLGYGAYTIIRKEDNAKIGVVGLFDREGVEGVDIGFSLLQKFYKKGYMYEAASALMHHAQHTLNLTKVSAITLEENKTSRALIEKLGLQLKQKNFKIPNDENELCLYEKEMS